VTLDLMIHDLDLLITMVKSKIAKISANGLKVISNTADIANARIEFENGCVANITADRTASGNTRKLTVYQNNTLIKIDLLNKITTVNKFKNASGETKNMVITPGKGIPDKEVIIEYPIILPTNAIKEELIAFHNSINTATKPVVTIEDAIDVLDLAFSIDEKILNVDLN
jgi:predicted dehydrogenase